MQIHRGEGLFGCNPDPKSLRVSFKNQRSPLIAPRTSTVCVISFGIELFNVRCFRPLIRPHSGLSRPIVFLYTDDPLFLMRVSGLSISLGSMTVLWKYRVFRP